MTTANETKYEREARQIDEAMALFPERFRLRAFPEMVCRIAPKMSHFVLNGYVQIIVQAYNHDMGVWQDLGRNEVAHVRREMLPILHEHNV